MSSEEMQVCDDLRMLSSSLIVAWRFRYFVLGNIRQAVTTPGENDTGITTSYQLVLLGILHLIRSRNQQPRIPVALPSLKTDIVTLQNTNRESANYLESSRNGREVK